MMATVLELAMLSDAVYGDGGELPRGWVSLGIAPEPNTVGYVGQAYINSAKSEIVIANKGTSTLKDVWSDIQLAALHETPAQRYAYDYARKVYALSQSQYPNATFIETGHSLGGNEAQAATSLLVDNGIQVSAVTFQAPGVAASYNKEGASYDILNIYNAGDIVRLAGGAHLGKSVSIDAGPSTVGEVLGAIFGFVIGGPLGAALVGGKLTLSNAHSIVTTVDYFKAHPDIGNQLPSQFTGVASTPSPSGLTGYTATDTAIQAGYANGATESLHVNGSTVSETATLPNGSVIQDSMTLDANSALTNVTISKVDKEVQTSYNSTTDYVNGIVTYKESHSADPDTDVNTDSIINFSPADGSLVNQSVSHTDAYGIHWDYTNDAQAGTLDFKVTNAHDKWVDVQAIKGSGLQTWTDSDGDSGSLAVAEDGSRRIAYHDADGTNQELNHDVGTDTVIYADGAFTIQEGGVNDDLTVTDGDSSYSILQSKDFSFTPTTLEGDLFRINNSQDIYTNNLGDIYTHTHFMGNDANGGKVGVIYDLRSIEWNNGASYSSRVGSDGSLYRCSEAVDGSHSQGIWNGQGYSFVDIHDVNKGIDFKVWHEADGRYSVTYVNNIENTRISMWNTTTILPSLVTLRSDHVTASKSNGTQIFLDAGDVNNSVKVLDADNTVLKNFDMGGYRGDSSDYYNWVP